MNELQNVLNEIKVEKDSKLLPENIKKGIQIFDITGTLEQGEASTDAPVKLFETIEEMQADETAKEGDLALVYRSELSNWDGASAITSLTFPKTVVLPSAMTGSCYGYSMGDVYIDIDGSVSKTSASFRIYGDTSYNITYTSTDGLTYTRTDTYDETLIFADEPAEMRMYDFSEVCGYFMRVGGKYFDGLYTYKTYTDTNSLVFLPINNISFTPAETTFNDITFNGIYDTVEYDISKIGNALHKQFPGRTSSVTIYQDTNNVLHVIPTPSGQYYSCLLLGVYDNTGKFLGLGNTNTTVVTCNQYRIDLETETCILEKEITTIASNHKSAYQYLPITDIKSFPVRYSFSSPENTIVNESYYGFGNYSTFTSYKSLVNTVNHHLDKTAYLISPTQLTLSSSDQLLPGKIGYGKNGVIEGNNTIYDNLSSEEMFIKTLGLPKQLDDSRYRVYDTAIKPSAIGDYAPYTATYVKETLDKANAKYKIGITDKYYTLRDITYITGEFYSNGYISRMAKTGKFGAVVKTITNEYKLLVINADFTEVEKVINVTATNINVSSTNRAMMLTITESSTVYKYAIFNVNTGTLVVYTTYTSNTSYTTKLMEDYAVCTVNKETFIINLKTDIVTTVGNMEYNWMTTRAFEFDDFFYVIVLINDGTKTEKLYKYDKITNELELQASYIGGPFSSNTTGVELLGKTCIEGSNYILDYATGLLFRKENTADKNTLFFCKRRITDGTILTGTSKWCENNIINQGSKVYKLSDNQNITFDDLSAGTPIYNLAVDTTVKTMNNMMGITISYDSEIGDYKNTEYSFNYTNVFKLDTVDEFECCDFSVYSKFKIKYFNDDLTDADYMLIRTSFVEPNYSFGSYIKLLPLNTNTILHEEYNTALDTVNEILGEEV